MNTRTHNDKVSLRWAIIGALLCLLVFSWKANAQTIGVPTTPAPIKAEQVAGKDGSGNMQVIKTDTSGNVSTISPTGASSNQVQGTTASGSAVVGNPVSVQGSDAISTAPTADPVTIGGYDVPNNFVRRYCAFTATADRSASYGAGGCFNMWALSAGGNLYDRPQSTSSANFTAASTLTGRNSAGAHIAEKGSRWAVNSAPAAGTVASASIALEAGVKHVLDTVCFSSGSAVAPALTSLQVNIRDGATGAGTVLMSFEVEIPATTGQDTPPICIGGLNLVGTAGTAMTVEWSAALANLKQTATAIGYNVN
jgi:hypothetical protein